MKDNRDLPDEHWVILQLMFTRLLLPLNFLHVYIILVQDNVKVLLALFVGTKLKTLFLGILLRGWKVVFNTHLKII